MCLRKSIKFHIQFGCFVIQNKHWKIFFFLFSVILRRDETTLYTFMMLVCSEVEVFFRYSRLHLHTTHLFMKAPSRKCFSIITSRPNWIIRNILNVLLILSYFILFSSLHVQLHKNIFASVRFYVMR